MGPNEPDMVTVRWPYLGQCRGDVFAEAVGNCLGSGPKRGNCKVQDVVDMGQ